jgi:hypothetical protein
MELLKVRRLNDAGAGVFRQWLVTQQGEAPKYLLTDDRYTDSLEQEYLLDADRRFETTFELGTYLTEVFGTVKDATQLRSASDIWAWVSLAMLPNLVGRSATKQGKPLDVAHYLEAEGSIGQRLGYRLIARTAWELVRIHGEKSRVALGSKRSPWGEMACILTSLVSRGAVPRLSDRQVQGGIRET